MKSKSYLKSIIAIILIGLTITSCKENEPKGDEFSWSPDGKKLVMVNVESKELVLVELANDKIEKITPIDTYSGEKAKIHMPSWSPDGKHILFAKSSKSALEIMTYSLNENKTTTIDRMAVNEKTNFEGKVFVSWLPKMNRVLWMSWNSFAEHLLFSALPDGKDRKTLIKLVGEKIFPFPACSSDGEWIAYSKHQKDGDKNNGLWKVKPDGSDNQQVVPANEVTAFQWNPDGSQLALVQKVVFQRNQKQGESIEISYKYNLLVCDSNGKNEKQIAQENLPIVKLAWSPDETKIAFFQDKNDSKNVVLVDLASTQKVRLNFNHAADFFGWNGPDQVLYSINYPDQLVPQTKEAKDARELLEALRGDQRESILISCDKSRQRKLGENFRALTVREQNNAIAYYKPFKTSVMGEELYYPVIEFSNGAKEFPARTREQFISVADELYLAQNYQAALDQLSKYWDVNFNSDDFKTKLDVDVITSKMKSSDDSTRLKADFEALKSGFLKNGNLLRTVIILRKLNQTEKADWLLDQYKKLAINVSKDDGDKEHKEDVVDEMFWTVIGIYSRYNELQTGINDLDRLLASHNLDSTLVAYANYAQAILALENKQHELGISKLISAVNFLPQNKADIEDIKGVVEIFSAKLSDEQESKLIPVVQQITQRFPTHENIFEIHEMLGDLYIRVGQREKGVEAYQTAAALHFDQHEIWDKIFADK